MVLAPSLGKYIALIAVINPLQLSAALEWHRLHSSCSLSANVRLQVLPYTVLPESPEAMRVSLPNWAIRNWDSPKLKRSYNVAENAPRHLASRSQCR